MKRKLHNFKIGITFSGKYREDYVEPFCNALLDLGYHKDDIFYDKWHEYLINGINGDDLLREIYYRHCELVVVLLSPDYKTKPWCGNVEWRAVKELINTGDGDKICLLRVDAANIGAIGGLYQTQSIAKTIDGISPEDVAEFIDKRYRYFANSDFFQTYKKPPFIPHSSDGVLLQDAWKPYITDIMERIAYFLQWNGVEWKTLGGQIWYKSYYYRGELLLRAIYPESAEVIQIAVWDSCRNGTEQSGNCVFDINNARGYIEIHTYIPGDWDKRIFSWETPNSPLPIKE